MLRCLPGTIMRGFRRGLYQVAIIFQPLQRQRLQKLLRVCQCRQQSSDTQSTNIPQTTLRVRWGAANINASQTRPPKQMEVSKPKIEEDVKKLMKNRKKDTSTTLQQTPPSLVDLERAVASLVSALASLDIRKADPVEDEFEMSTLVEQEDGIYDPSEDISRRTRLRQKLLRLQEFVQSPTPYYVSRNTAILDKNLKRILSQNNANHIAAVCYALLISNAAPSLKTFNILIRGFSLLRQNAVVDRLLHTLAGLQYVFDKYTYAAVLNYHTSTNNYHAFLHIYKDLLHSAHSHNLSCPWVNSCVVVGLSKFRRFRKLKFYLSVMNDRKVCSSREVYTIQLKAAAQHKNWIDGSRIMYHVLHLLPEDVDEMFWYWCMQLCKNCKEKAVMEWLQGVAKERNIPSIVFDQLPTRTKNLHAITGSTNMQQRNGRISISGNVPSPSVFDLVTDDIDYLHNNAKLEGDNAETCPSSMVASTSPLSHSPIRCATSADPLWQRIVTSRKNALLTRRNHTP